MDNPAGYVYRIAARRAARSRPHIPILFPATANDGPWVEPGLPAALETLSERQRTVVVLVHGFGSTHSETAELLGISLGSVQRHLDRGLKKLRSRLGVQAHD